jgi:hypothetical protein
MKMNARKGNQPIKCVVHNVGIEEAGAVDIAFHGKIHADPTLGVGRNWQHSFGQRILQIFWINATDL